MPTYWIAAIVVFFVYLLPVFYAFQGDNFDMEDSFDVFMCIGITVLMSLILGTLWPLTVVGTVLFFVVRWLEGVRVK